MAAPHRPGVLTAAAPSDRYRTVSGAQIALGLLSGSISILSADLHSLIDSASNVVGLVGVSVVRRPPDANHPYGYRKFETMASVGILVFLALVLVEVISGAVGRWRSGSVPEVPGEGLVVLLATLAVNVVVARYERLEGLRLGSEILRADARHTSADVFITCGVIVALMGVWLGYPLLDPLAALVVTVFIGRAGVHIARGASRTLADEIALPPERVRDVVTSVGGVFDCEKIRTRGSRDYVFLDLHLWVDGERTLSDAHALSHVVKARLMERFPQFADVIIHIEPPPSGR